MAQANPAAYSAYVGTGQAAEVQAKTDAWVYRHLLERAKAVGDTKGLAELNEAGPPPWTAGAGQKAYQASAPYRGPDISLAEGAKAAFTAPHWTVADVQALSRGRSAYKGTQLERDIAAFDPAQFGLYLAMPVIVIEGADDLTTPAPLAEAWLQRLKAPKKAFITIPNAGHQALVTNNAIFSEALKQKLDAMAIRAN
jgi:pimeloyl-ACP methyl ester carboxylesterase